jgi:large subunit ribosomal protein L24
MKIIKNDTVLVLSGKYKNKTGKVEKAIPKDKTIIVTGVNIIKKNSKPTKKNPKGGIIEITKPIDISNVMLVCPKCNKKTRVGYKISKNKKVRICKKCKENV